MPRNFDKYRRRRSRRHTPALRIHTKQRPDTGQRGEDRGSADPLDHVAAIRPTDLVPDSRSPVAVPSDRIMVDADFTAQNAEPTLEEYIQRIEASAARRQAEQDGTLSHAEIRHQVSAVSSDVADRQQARRRLRPGQRKKTRQAKPTGPWYRRKRTWFIVAMVVPLLLVAAATAYVLNIVRLSIDAYDDINVEQADRTRWTVNPQGTPEPLPSAQVEAVLPDWGNEDPINILLLGVDTRTGDTQPPRSDTTIVVHVDPATDQISMMSIPRDLMVFVPGHGRDKFNAAYPVGEANDDEIPGGGPTLVAQTVEANFNIQVHYFATIDFNGFKQVVDTVGGVVIDVETQLSDNLYPTDDLRLTRVYFPTGLQKMDGKSALQYVRTRHADSDFGRAERQQQVLMAIREQAVSLDLITRAQSLIRDMQDTVRTDLNFNEMLALANLGRNVQADQIARLNLWERGLLVEHLPEFDGDAYYIEADWNLVLAETQAFFGGAAQATEDAAAEGTAEPDYSVSVFVENATNIPLLAGSSAQLLVDAGYVEVWPSDARGLQVQTVIEASSGQRETARHIARLLGLPDSVITTDESSNGITVTLGEDVPNDLIPDPNAEPVAGG